MSQPVVASMATRPCLISAWRHHGNRPALSPFEKPAAFPDFDHAGIVLMPSGAGKSHFAQHLPIELKGRVIDGDALVEWARKPGSGITAAQHKKRAVEARNRRIAEVAKDHVVLVHAGRSSVIRSWMRLGLPVRAVNVTRSQMAARLAVRAAEKKADPSSVRPLSLHQRLSIPTVEKTNQLYRSLSEETDGLPVLSTISAAINSLPSARRVQRRCRSRLMALTGVIDCTVSDDEVEEPPAKRAKRRPRAPSPQQRVEISKPDARDPARWRTVVG